MNVKAKKDQPNLFSKHVNILIQQKNSGQYFGFDECVCNMPRRHQVLCSSDFGTIIAIRKIFFIKKIWNVFCFKNFIASEIENLNSLE